MPSKMTGTRVSAKDVKAYPGKTEKPTATKVTPKGR
jgi:hypothetical protein